MTADRLQRLAAIAALADPNICAAVAAADPERETSLLEELGRRRLSGSARTAIEDVWYSNDRRRGRSRYVQRWHPTTQ